MSDAIRLNRALLRGEEIAEQLIRERKLVRDEYEHDLFYGNPDLALYDILEDLMESSSPLSKTVFDEILEIIVEIRGDEESDEARERFLSLLED